MACTQHWGNIQWAQPPYHSPQGKVGGAWGPNWQISLGQEGFGVQAEFIPCMFTMYLMHVLMYKGHIYNACTYVGASICTPVILSEPNKGFIVHVYIYHTMPLQRSLLGYWICIMAWADKTTTQFSHTSHSSSKYQVNVTPTVLYDVDCPSH